MLSQLAAASGIVLLIGTALLIVLGERLRWSHWLITLAGGAATFALALRLEALFARRPIPFETALAVGVLGTALVAAAFPEWTSIGHIAFTAVVVPSITFVAYAAYILAQARLGPLSLLFSAILLVFQAAALVLLVAHTFEIVDVTCRSTWRSGGGAKRIEGYAPMVSLHVPTHNEPPEMVIETLDALSRLDYPAFEVLVIDNNTADDSLWRPVEEHCRALGPRFRFFHLLPWPGFKSGALNFALRETAPEAEIVGIVDADYLVRPSYLADLVGHFHDAKVAFVQTPQDYRDVEARGTYGRALYLSYLYFFKISMATRNEHNAIIFVGTMGLLRRRALEKAGGWNEWCITEDAELSVRLLDVGGESVYIDESYGRGVMPLDFAGLKKQRFRWAFGGMQLLRIHAGRLLAPRGGSALTGAQRFAFISGGLQWLNAPFSMVFLVFLLIGSVSLVVGGSFFLQPLVGATIVMPLLFLFSNLQRFLWAFRVRARCRWRDACRALVILLGLTWVDTLACVRGLSSRQGVFLRTPKSGGRLRVSDALRIVWWESAMGILCVVLATAVLATRHGSLLSARGIVVAILLWNAVVQASAVQSSFWNYAEQRSRDTALHRPGFHTLGHATGRLVSERRTAVWVVAAAIALAAFFFLAQRFAPPWERIMRSDPRQEFLSARSVLPRDEAGEAGGVLVLEADAARKGDVAAALALWDREGRIFDRNYTPLDNGDDRVWTGPAGLRERYLREFRLRHYSSIEHVNPHVIVHGDEAVITDDLKAELRTGGRTQRLFLPQSDRWVLRRSDGEWRIVQLEVNRTGPPPGTGKAGPT